MTMLALRIGTRLRMRSGIKAQNNFEDIIAREGISRTDLAQASEVSPRTIDSLANPAGYQREGYTRPITAWKIAKGFAKLTKHNEEEAFKILFIDLRQKEDSDAQ